MRIQSKSLPAFLAFVMLLLSFLGYLSHYGLAQGGTNVSYIISQDTTWTASGSPYTLVGNTLVYQGVTLTIQPGVTVNLGSYYIEVNGTVNARGLPSNRITFNGGQITFTTSSNSWNEQTDSGCIIQYANINQTTISSSKPIKIDSSTIQGQISTSDNYVPPIISVTSSIMSNNKVTGDINSQSAIPAEDESNPPVDTSVISGNEINGNIVIGALTTPAITAPYETCSVFNNTVDGSIISGSPQDTPQIYDNTVSGGGIQCTGYGSISNNYVYGCQEGISLYTVRVFGGEFPCYATVENNLIVDNSHGIDIELTSVFVTGTICPTISSNTIFGNSVGIYLSESNYNSTPIIENNNIQNNSDYNFYLQAPNNVSATYDWWGTTNQQAINQTIYDFKADFNLGTVNFVPFLTATNPQAPVLLTPTATPTPTPISTSTSAVPEFPALVLVPLLLSLFSVAVILRHRKTANLNE